MSISETIAEFEASQRRKAQEEQAQREAANKEAEAEKIRRAGNAKEVETHLRTVVLPVLESSREEIRKRGYTCEIETVSIHDPAYEGAEPTFALRLNLSTDTGKARGLAMLEYEGQFASVTMRKEQTIPTKGRPIRIVDLDDDGFRPLNQFNAEIVKRHVEEFVSAVFVPIPI